MGAKHPVVPLMIWAGLCRVGVVWMLRELHLLTRSAVMLDEAHERTLYTDIAIGLLKKVWLRCRASVFMFLFCFVA